MDICINLVARCGLMPGRTQPAWVFGHRAGLGWPRLTVLGRVSLLVVGLVVRPTHRLRAMDRKPLPDLACGYDGDSG